MLVREAEKVSEPTIASIAQSITAPTIGRRTAAAG
jgi:hypothetical protein